MNRDESDLSGARPLGQTDDASVVGLLRQLSREVPALFTKELALAKAELQNSLSTLKAGIGAVAGGAIVFLAGFIILLMSAVYGLGMFMAPWLAALIVGVLPMPVLFMIAFGIAMTVNYRCLNMQKQRIAAHAENVLAVVSLIFAAGIFTGILNNTGMVEAMSHSFLAVIPEAWGPYLAVITALASMPFTFFMSNDACYVCLLPILSRVRHVGQDAGGQGS